MVLGRVLGRVLVMLLGNVQETVLGMVAERSARVSRSGNTRKRNVVPGWVGLKIQGNGTEGQGGWVWKYKETERSARAPQEPKTWVMQTLLSNKNMNVPSPSGWLAFVVTCHVRDQRDQSAQICGQMSIQCERAPASVRIGYLLPRIRK